MSLCSLEAGAEPTPLGGCEKFVIKFPLHEMSSDRGTAWAAVPRL